MTSLRTAGALLAVPAVLVPLGLTATAAQAAPAAKAHQVVTTDKAGDTHRGPAAKRLGPGAVRQADLRGVTYRAPGDGSLIVTWRLADVRRGTADRVVLLEADPVSSRYTSDFSVNVQYGGGSRSVSVFGDRRERCTSARKTLAVRPARDEVVAHVPAACLKVDRVQVAFAGSTVTDRQFRVAGSDSMDPRERTLLLR